mmetsp:Transcript_14610/g.41628  ORF Transcript_14610/g.41628 Transcript_14610/m.41628 type:complete len:97 (-) Transcript_14610:888-1178(-)
MVPSGSRRRTPRMNIFLSRCASDSHVLYASRTLAESGYTVVTEINGFSLACPPGQSGNTTFAATVTCTCEPSGESCSIFKDGEPSTEEAFVAAFSD